MYSKGLDIQKSTQKIWVELKKNLECERGGHRKKSCGWKKLIIQKGWTSETNPVGKKTLVFERVRHKKNLVEVKKKNVYSKGLNRKKLWVWKGWTAWTSEKKIMGKKKIMYSKGLDIKKNKNKKLSLKGLDIWKKSWGRKKHEFERAEHKKT